jgi:hypothetical protein
MAYSRETIPSNHTEFGGGPGLIDPEKRKDRELLGYERLWEIYATDPTPPEFAHGTTDEEIAAAKARIERDNDPAEVSLDFPNRGRK